MSDKRNWILLLAITVVGGGGLGGLIYWQQSGIDAARAEIETVKQQIEADRQLVSKTPQLERDVIVRRETDQIIRQILPNNDDVNNFVRTLRNFEEVSGVRISSVKQARIDKRQQSADFDKVAYTLQFDANAFELLAFVDKVETHSRFMSIPTFKLTAARGGGGSEEEPRHRVQLDVETYVYAPRGGTSPVEIDNYGRKRELLLSEIARREEELEVKNFLYRGPRGRRDPWVDPRIPVDQLDDNPQLPIEQQIAIVDELVERIEDAQFHMETFSDAVSLIEEMKARAELENDLSYIEDQEKQIEAENRLTYPPMRTRYEREVLDVLREIREDLTNREGETGPEAEALAQVIETMTRYKDRGEYEFALQSFDAIESRLDLIHPDDARAPLVGEIEELRRQCQTALDFQAVELDIRATLVTEDSAPIAVINGRSMGIGEMVTPELFIRNIRTDEIEFLFRGVVLTRRLSP